MAENDTNRNTKSAPRRRASGTVELLPSGRFRACVLGPDRTHVSAPMTFDTPMDATAWLGSCAHLARAAGDRPMVGAAARGKGRCPSAAAMDPVRVRVESDEDKIKIL